MNEEAGFIAALLAEPDDVTTLLVYADWLDERADPRAEYLRLLAAVKPSRRRMGQLRRSLNSDWVGLIDTRHFRVGMRALIERGSFAQMEGAVVAISPDRRNATVRPILWGRPVEVDVPLTDLTCVGPAES